MENLSDYSSYVSAAYIVAALVFSGLTLHVLIKYKRAKSSQKNEK